MMPQMRTPRAWRAGLRERLDATNLPASPRHRRLVNGLVVRPMRRVVLRRRLPRAARRLSRGITVLVPVRDRAGYRLRNLLRSLRGQTARQEMIVLVVDYASQPEQARRLADLATAYDAEVLRVDDGPPEWNRSRSLNCGIRRAHTEFILCADADLVFQSNYVETVLRRLRLDPLLLVVSAMLDLPQGHPTDISADDVATLQTRAYPRFDAAYHPSIIAVRRDLVELIGGYDESFRLWGGEDVDLFLRLRSFGVDVENIRDESVYLHQWHPKFEGVSCDSLPAQIRWNDNHLRGKRVVRQRWSLP